MIFRRIFDARLIPIELVKQVPNTDVKQFYIALENLALMETTIIEIFQDEELNIVGFAWAVLEITSLELHINTVSMKKEFQGSGKYLKEYIEHLRQSLKQSAIKKVTWCTDRPAFYERLGFKRSKEIYLEIELKNIGDQDGQEKARN